MYLFFNKILFYLFGYAHNVPRNHVFYAPCPMNVYQIDQAFQDYGLHMITKEMQEAIVDKNWEADHGYIIWFYMASHPLLILPIERNPPRPANWEVFIEGEHTQHVDPLWICWRV